MQAFILVLLEMKHDVLAKVLRNGILVSQEVDEHEKTVANAKKIG